MGTGGSPPQAGLAYNLGVFSRRLKRVRVPSRTAPYRSHATVVLAGAAITVLLVAVLVFAADTPSVAWAKGLPRLARDSFQTITRFGQSEWLLIPTGLFALALLFANWSRVDRRVAAAWTEVGELVGFFFFAVAVAGLVTDVIKWTVGRSRPVLFAEDGVFTFHPISFAYANVSFPSGHATTAAAAFVACLLIFRGKTWLLVLVGLFAAAVAVSRVAVRAHFPSDVVAGAFVGAAFTYLYAYALGRNGVAFQRQPDGTLMPKTIAVRLMFGRPGGGRRMLEGLKAAWFGGAKEGARP